MEDTNKTRDELLTEVARLKGELEEEALRQSQENFRQLAEAIPQLVWITRPDGSYEYFNQQWYNYTNSSRKQAGKKGWGHLLHPEDRTRTIEAWQKSLHTGEPYEMEYRIKDGKTDGYRWFLVRAVPVKDEQGQIIDVKKRF